MTRNQAEAFVAFEKYVQSAAWERIRLLPEDQRPRAGTFGSLGMLTPEQTIELWFDYVAEKKR